MIGFFNYTVIATYVSLACSVFGITLAFGGYVRWAILCLMLSGFLDAFDGRIARTRKNSTQEEKCFGVQIDSLCDLICFGALPVSIGAALGATNWFGVICMILFVLAGVIRLGYFNVTEEMRQQTTTECRKFYEGFPITSSALIVPLAVLCKAFLSDAVFPNFFAASLLLIAFLYVLKIKIPKFTLGGILVCAFAGAVEFILISIMIYKHVL